MTPVMRTGLMGLALVELALAAMMVLQIDRRAKRLRGRVERLSVAPSTVTAVPQRAAVRRLEYAKNRPTLLRAILGIPAQALPGASVPIWLAGSAAMLAGGFCGMLSGLFVSPLLVPFAGVAAAVLVVRFLYKRQHSVYARKLLLQMPDTIELVVSAVRAGLPIGEALRSVAREMPSPTSEEFAQVCNAIALGTPADVAIRAVHERSGLTEYGIFSVTLAVQSRSGGRLAETIQTLAETTRQRVAMAAKARALSAEARLSARALQVLPMIAGVLLSLEQPGYVTSLMSNAPGRRLIGIAAVTMTLGTLTMRRMIQWASDP